MALSTMKQAELMRKEWPMFKILRRTRWEVLWEGPLRPLCQPYTIQVLLWREKNLNKSNPPRTPQVTVIDPLLRRRSARSIWPYPASLSESEQSEAAYSVPLRSG